jgi:hypothetical protein
MCRASMASDAATTAWEWRVMILTAATLALAACASNPAKEDGYNAFLRRIAAECKPLIIGSDDIGQAIVFNGLGAIPENYNNFLGKTSALYNATISPQLYRDSLTSFLGGGTYNQRSFDCIIAHLPSASTAK